MFLFPNVNKNNCYYEKSGITFFSPKFAGISSAKWNVFWPRLWALLRRQYHQWKVDSHRCQMLLRVRTHLSLEMIEEKKIKINVSIGKKNRMIVGLRRAMLLQKKAESISRSTWLGIVLHGWSDSRDREYWDSSKLRRNHVGLRPRITEGETYENIRIDAVENKKKLSPLRS